MPNKYLVARGSPFVNFHTGLSPFIYFEVSNQPALSKQTSLSFFLSPTLPSSTLCKVWVHFPCSPSSHHNWVVKGVVLSRPFLSFEDDSPEIDTAIINCLRFSFGHQRGPYTPCVGSTTPSTTQIPQQATMYAKNLSCYRYGARTNYTAYFILLLTCLPKHVRHCSLSKGNK